MLRLCQSIAGGAIITSALVTSANADALVRVSLIDKTGEVDLSKSMGLGMGMHGDMNSAGMAINASPKVVPRGKIRFDVTNLASRFVHEVIIAPVADENQQLTYDATKNKVDEETIKTLGQVAEIEPNKSASLTLELKPGKYVLYCNLPGHFMAGMWTVVEVK
jgi:uncharacterized cupredoxin-like copper-binding protein